MTVAVALIGALDAAIGRSWDLVAVLGLVALLQLLLLARLSSRRPTVPIRADLLSWAQDRANLEGDRPDLIVDRALAAYRAALLGSGDGTDDAVPN